MGGCASKPKDLDTEKAPAPVEAPAVEAAPAEPEAAAPQDKKEETEAAKEEPLVDLSEPAPAPAPAPEAPKTEELIELAKEITKEAEPAAEAKPQEPEAKAPQEPEAKPKEEEKKEVVAEPAVEAAPEKPAAEVTA